MDRLLQSHQAETTARRLQLERTLSQRQGELKQRTQELESLTARTGEDRTTIAELRKQLLRTKEDQRNLFSGSQAQLIAKVNVVVGVVGGVVGGVASIEKDYSFIRIILFFFQDSKVSSLEVKLKDAESALERASKEAERLRSEVGSLEGREREGRVKCEQLQSQVKVLTTENDSLHAKHLREVSRPLNRWGLGVTPCVCFFFVCLFVCLFVCRWRVCRHCTPQNSPHESSRQNRIVSNFSRWLGRRKPGRRNSHAAGQQLLSCRTT